MSSFRFLHYKSIKAKRVLSRKLTYIEHNKNCTNIHQTFKEKYITLMSSLRKLPTNMLLV